MRFRTLLPVAAAMLVTAPAFAGNLTFDNGQTVWHSTSCNRPSPPAPYASAGSEAAGDQLNAMVAQHNAYADQAQQYMNCITSEAGNDQRLVDQQITASAQRQIADMQAQVDQTSADLARRQARMNKH